MIDVAVISDLHGNMEALKAVFEDIDNLGIKNILVLGDLALMGPEPNEAISFVKNLSEKYNVEIIQGNTDLMILNPINENLHQVLKNTIVYAKENVSEENKTFLKNLPVTKSIKIGETSILMTHGSPRKQDENILPNRPIEEIKPILENVEESLILCGHTHLPAGYQVDNRTVVNDGSVGRPFTENQKACYVVLNIDENKPNTFGIEHKFINYDANSAAEKLRAQNYEGAEYLADLLVESKAQKF